MLNTTNMRYDRLSRLSDIIDRGIDLFRTKTVAIIGCGGLGGAIITLLCRYPIGKLVIIDRDLVDETNLGHQLLFTPFDALGSFPKVVAAESYIKKVNPEIEVIPHFIDLRSTNIDDVLTGCNIILDGLDNFGTRFLVNDWCMENEIPYVYGGLVEREAVTKVIIPQVTSCLRCLIPEQPPAGATRTCDVYGIHLPVITTLASLMVDTALTVLGARTDVDGELTSLRYSNSGLKLFKSAGSKEKNPNCRSCCGHYDFLDAKLDNSIVHVCGQNALSITLGDETDVKQSLERLVSSDNANFEIKTTDYYVRMIERRTKTIFTVFTHGRVLMEGSDVESKLRSFVSKYIGI